jgi:hypothetical protein
LGEEVKDTEKLAVLLISGLSKTFEPVVAMIEIMDEQVTPIGYSAAVEKLKDFDNRGRKGGINDSANQAMLLKKVPRPVAEITCFHCQEKGHYAKYCPKLGHSASQVKSNDLKFEAW